VGDNPRHDERVHNAIQIAPNSGVFGLGEGACRLVHGAWRTAVLVLPICGRMLHGACVVRGLSCVVRGAWRGVE
jgi:hypothetical protein